MISESHSFDWRLRPVGVPRHAQGGAQQPGGSSSTRIMHLAVQRLREVEEFHQLMRRLLLYVEPTRLSFCAIGATASASAPSRSRYAARTRTLVVGFTARPLNPSTVVPILAWQRCC
eukprot:1456147-Prymnesium_polylepis.2